MDEPVRGSSVLSYKAVSPITLTTDIYCKLIAIDAASNWQLGFWGDPVSGRLLPTLFLSACLTAPPAFALGLVQIETSESVLEAQVPLALSRGTVMARLGAGEVLALPSGEVGATETSSLYLAASSEFLSVAVLRGAITMGGRSAGPGEVLVRSIAGTRVERFAFDARAFGAATPGGALTDEERDSLRAILVEQERRIFWGGLERTGFDAQAPSGDPMMEAVRRDYLLRPAVMDVRAAALGDAKAIGREVASRFVAGLAARDAETVEALLSPTLFTDGGRRQTEWLSDRSAFALDLVAGGMPTTLSNAVIGEGGLSEGYAVDVNGAPWRVRLQPLDSMVFVTALEPAGSGDTGKGQ
ncbi:MAG: hypothetical protein ACK4QW_12220 [Alphaproteobacteria bacterium]